MRALSAAELLDIWERGQARSPAQRALVLLTAACSDTPADLLAKLSIGQRDACLLTLREWIFGPQLDCLVICPECSERLELALDVADIRVADLAPAPSPEWEERGEAVGSGEAADVLSLGVGDYEVEFRLPNSLDLVAIAGSEDAEATRHLLLERCLLTAHCGDKDPSAHQLPAGVVDAVVERMVQADPQADVQLAVACPSCDHQWQVTFDIVSFFWSELNTWAQRTLYEVHTLARAYGWREADILATSPWRRQFYLEMVSG